MTRPIVIKISGHQIDDPKYLTDLAQVISGMKQPKIIVHGGGKEISQLQEQLGITPRYIDGVRVTDQASLDLVVMTLCGTVNKRLVHYLVSAGVNALGLSGIDMKLIQAEPMHHSSVDMGFTGHIMSVNREPLLTLLHSGITPVIAPPCYGENSIYNVNGDHVAGAVAQAVQAESIIFLSNVEGVLQDDTIIPNLTSEQTQKLINDEVITGGMIPKVEMALSTLASGVESVVISNLEGLQTHGGTVFTQSN